MSRAAVRKMLAEYDLSDRAEAILELARPCWWLGTTDSAGSSRIGGEPDLPPGLPWPQSDGHELTYLAQIDLAEFADEALPHDGLLVFFYDRSDFYVGIDPCRVVHVRGATKRRAIPTGLETFRERRFVGERGISFPILAPDSPFVGLIADSDEERDALHDWSSIVDEDLGRGSLGHQLLGYPTAYQNDTLMSAARAFGGVDEPALVAEARRLRLLLQLREDDDLQWAGGGKITFVMRPDDLAAARFERTCVTIELG